MTRFIIIVFVCFFGGCSSQPAPASSLQSAHAADRADTWLSGSWTGTWARESDSLTVSMHFEREGTGWKGSFDSERLPVVVLTDPDGNPILIDQHVPKPGK